jgi:hypothetical protein
MNDTMMITITTENKIISQAKQNAISVHADEIFIYAPLSVIRGLFML